MSRSSAAGFSGQQTPVASPRLIDAVVASLAVSLCLVVMLTALSLHACMATPL